MLRLLTIDMWGGTSCFLVCTVASLVFFFVLPCFLLKSVYFLVKLDRCWVLGDYVGGW